MPGRLLQRHKPRTVTIQIQLSSEQCIALPSSQPGPCPSFLDLLSLPCSHPRARDHLLETGSEIPGQACGALYQHLTSKRRPPTEIGSLQDSQRTVLGNNWKTRWASELLRPLGRFGRILGGGPGSLDMSRGQRLG